MTLHLESKIQSLLQQWPPDVVATSSWLESLGISRQLQRHYTQSGWMESIGRGAYKRKEASLSWQGGLFAIQSQLKLPIHAGGLTALSLQGLSHYLRFNPEPVYLLAPPKTKLPTWFKTQASWENALHWKQTLLFPPQMALNDYYVTSIGPLKISSPERAILECLYLTPEATDWVESYELLEGLANLRPQVLQELLEACQSIRVTRLFLYMAHKLNHPWFKHLHPEKLNLGQGVRTLAKGGVYDARYQLVVPKALAAL